MKRTERGWAGHFICADRCLFRRNTLIEHGDIKIVVSTVGLMRDFEENGFKEVGSDRYYETVAFHADENDVRYHDINVERQVYFNSDWAISELDADDKANVMHDNVVTEIANGLLGGNEYDS